MISNTCVTDVTGHPACSVPAGLVNGLPTGLMIVGNQFDDATVLRVANTFEQAVGGFPGAGVNDRREQSMNGVHDLGGTDGLGTRSRTRLRAGLPGGVGEGRLRHVLDGIPRRVLRP